MRIIRAIFSQVIDLAFFVVSLGLFLWHAIDQSKNFSGLLWVFSGYTLYIIYNKVKLRLKG